MKELKLSKEIIKKIKLQEDKCTGCKLCMENCPMLDNYCSTPKELLKAAVDSETMKPEIPYSCALCGYCSEVCPEKVDLNNLFYELRRFTVIKNKGVPKEFGAATVKFHQKNSFSKLFTTKIKSFEGGDTEKIFFPGCSLTAYSPEIVMKVYKYLNDKFPGTGILLKCCGKPTQSMGDEARFEHYYSKVQADFETGRVKEIITACQNCYKIMSKYSPNIKVTSLWEVIAKEGIPKALENRGIDLGVKFALHDPCPTRKEDTIHASVREILSRLGIEIEELKYSRNETLCCGSGGMLGVTNKKLALKHMKKRADQAEASHFVTYCEECVQSLKRGGKQAVHILDLLFNEDIYVNKDFNQSSKGTLNSWINRYNGTRLINNRRF
jgi:Fe-S oxidoreductase